MLNLEPSAPNLPPNEQIRGISVPNESLKLKLQANSLYITAILQDPQTLQDISRDTQSLLIDSGATRNFVDINEAKRLRLPIDRLNQPIRVTLIDGNDSIAGLITHTTTLQLKFDDGSEQLEKFYLTKIDEEHPWVLGYDWLRRRNPEINWSEPSIIFDRNAEKARAIRLFESPPKTESNESCKGEIKGGEKTDIDEQIRRIQNKKRKKPPDKSQTPRNTPRKSKRKVIPTRRTKHYVQRIRATKFVQLVEDEDLPVMMLHIRAVTSETTSEKKAKPNSGGYEAQGKNDDKEMTDEEVLKAKVPPEYHEFKDVFSAEEAKELPPHRSYDHKIETIDGQLPPHGRIYNMSQVELDALKSYIDEMLAKGFIRTSNSPIGAPVLFVKKKNGTLRLCVDYRALNKITVKNRYPLPLSGDLMDRLSQAKIYTKIDLRVGYNNIRIAEGEEWKTAFRTRYGSYEYLVMPFGLTNAPATFQYFMNDIFHDLLDVCVVVYLDDILIYSDDIETHRKQVKDVLARLRKHNLHARPEKSGFHMNSIEYLGVIISPTGIAMDPEKVKVILDWPAPTTVKELQSFLGFANFYRRFIDNYSGITKALTSLLKKNSEYIWTDKCENAFQILKKAFTEAPVLRHFDPEDMIVLESDASDYAIAGILSQYDKEGVLRPVAFYGRTMIAAELNYDIYDKELLAIVECFRLWRHYLEGAKYTIQVFTDHNNLQYFTTTKQLSRRQARWSERFASFDFVINYRPGRLGAKPDAITRRPDVYPKKTFQDATNALNNKILIPPEQLRAVVAINEHKTLRTIINSTKNAGLDEEGKSYQEQLKQENSPFTQEGQLILRDGRIYIPDIENLRFKVIQSYHDHKLRGHPGVRKTRELIMRDMFWKGITKDIEHYVKACPICRRAKAVRAKPYGFLKQSSIPDRKWSHLTMDHIEQLPPSGGYDSILVIVDRMTKQAIFIPCYTSDKAIDLARHFIQHVFSKHGVPFSITSDRGKLFVSEVWTEICKMLDIKSALSTAYHPETDGQTERVNQILEQYLRCYINYLQDDWSELLPLAEFAYNNTPQDSIGMTPFFANKGYHPVLNVDVAKVQGSKLLETAQDWDSLNQYLKEKLQESFDKAAMHHDSGKRQTPRWKVGDMVYLNSKNIKTKRPTKKFDWKNFGPFKITECIGSHAYRLKLPKDWKIHNVFHVNLLSKAPIEKFPQRKTSSQADIELEEEKEYEIERVLDIRKIGRSKENPKYEYLVRWVGYDENDDLWQAPETLHAAKELVLQFHRENPDTPKPFNLTTLFEKGKKASRR